MVNFEKIGIELDGFFLNWKGKKLLVEKVIWFEV